VQAAIAGSPIPLHDLPLVLGKKRGAGNHGHWLMEMLPALHLVLDRLRDERIGVLVHDVSDPQLGEVMQTSLRRIGVADTHVRVAGPWPVRVRTLILVDGLTMHGTYMSPLVCDCHERLLHGVTGLGHERVFIARGVGYQRNFADFARVEALAAEQGFHHVQASRLTLLEQVAAVRDARVVAGAMGAAMTSLAFARTPAQALLFAGAAMPDTFFWFLATLFGHRYREIRCDQVAEPSDDAVSYNGDLLIDDDELRQHLAVA
jgi:capsular polysaccharide biosynthesis protein